MNKIILIGNTTRDLQVGRTQTGKLYARGGLAVDRINKKTAPAGQPTADFFDFVAWERTAEILQQYTPGKGHPLAIEGHVQTRTYEKDGVKRRAWEVVVDRAELIRGNQQNAQQGAPVPQAAPVAPPAPQMAPAQPVQYAAPQMAPAAPPVAPAQPVPQAAPAAPQYAPPATPTPDDDDIPF